LPHHCEFLSDEWLEQATKFLQRDIKMRREKLGGRSFSLSERFVHAPPHMKFAGDVATWSVRFDGNDVTVSRHVYEGADVLVEGDYQAALTAAQFVGLLAPGAMETMNREIATLYGNDAIRVKGNLEGEPREMLVLLHDHMGRRTVENPDLAHRAARQGLSGKIRELESRGYAVTHRSAAAQSSHRSAASRKAPAPASSLCIPTTRMYPSRTPTSL
jgi:hypothetical protein